ncbi:prohead peptidase [Breoghania corrubedonensis]|uniref:Prohead peptidase n=1 Tax=Breoghania corrubedonensis TaxID=665038 RepID=A0A2T5V1Q2_9HYPH|nr:HK97 family phage prohead protease [Breoghania corrubedonensis]PTW57660.1 prohead peptidase [Breoghania corrubedonensis]
MQIMEGAIAPAAPPAPLTVSDAGVFSGYAALFGVADLGRDILMPGAFTATLRQRGAAGIKLLYQHEPAEPIGRWLEIVEDGRGLKVRGELMPDLARAREVLSLMKAGVLDGLSIGFRTVRGKRDPRTGIRRLNEVDLWEISVVTFPMQEGARIDAMKRAHVPAVSSGARLRRVARRMRLDALMRGQGAD